MSDILTHTDAGVMTITFNRLDKKNSITSSMYAAMADAVAQAVTDAAVKVVVFQGHESIFSAGNDIGDFLNQPPSTQESPVFRFLRGIATFEKPLLAAVAGPAVGIGTTMLFHCDLVYAGDNAAFSMPFVNLGLCPEAASSLLVPRMFGYHRAAEALLLGEPFFAEAAQEVGLVNRVVPPTEVNGYAQAQARKLAAKPLSSLIETKRLMKGDTQAVLQKMAEEGASFGRMLQEPAAKEAFGAFMEKRKPDFSKL
ncbi:enoyl-CoA hydratase [Limnohabitans planktonicus]|uniref:Enoyl-CoA hydratase n=1 Tax=Limnohabitans planktonicus II-D5 TaxID=1293045 RepID=A0A2T7U8L8_9BURK|nr:enoyl-CoA hydratase [Limnohabitans planktonicus]PVE41020.1 enoyl-CoA hydratase [Limnohabitans planktonicus II-D5]|eukprot:gene3877-3791_t